MNNAAIHSCPIPGCDHPRRDHHFMCPSHWYRVPRQLQCRLHGLQLKSADPAARERTLAAAVDIAAALSAHPRRIIHAAKVMIRVCDEITLPSLCEDLAISKKRGAAILEMMINKGLIDDGDYFGIYHRKENA